MAAAHCWLDVAGPGSQRAPVRWAARTLQAAEGSIYTSAATFEELNLSPDLLKVCEAVGSNHSLQLSVCSLPGQQFLLLVLPQPPTALPPLPPAAGAVC